MKQHYNKYLLIPIIALTIIVVALFTPFRSKLLTGFGWQKQSAFKQPEVVQAQSIFPCNDAQYQNSPMCQGIHPRIWLTTEVEEKLKARIASGTSREWQDLKAACQRIINGEQPFNKIDYLPGLALAYRLTKDTDPVFAVQCRDEALKLMDGLCNAWLPATREGTNDYYYVDTGEWFYWRGGGYSTGFQIRFNAVHLALAYDWLYDYLAADTTTETWIERDNSTHENITRKRKYEIMLMRWIDWYDERGPFKAPSGSNHFVGYFAAKAHAAIVLYGEDTQKHPDYAVNTPGTIDDFQLQYDDLLNRLFPQVQQIYNVTLGGGDWPESMQYGPLVAQNFAGFALAVESATGYRIANDFTWLKEHIDYRIHSIYPLWNYQYSGGEWRNGNGWIDPVPMMTLSELFQNEPAGQKAQFYLNNVNINRDEYKRAWIFLWYDPNRQALDYRTADNRSYTTAAGFINLRSDWQNNQTFIILQAGGPNVGSHQYSANGHFLIYKNGHLALPAPQWIEGNANNNNNGYLNTILLNTAEGTRGQGGFARDCPILFEDKDDFVYVRGDITDAYVYHPWARPNYMESITRSYVFIRPNYFLVFDRVESKDPTHKKIWQLHTDDPAVVNGDTFEVTQIKTEAKMFGKILLPETDNRFVEVLDNDPRTPGTMPILTYVLRIKNTQDQPQTNFFNVMSITDVMPEIIRIDSTGNNMVGTKIESAGQDISVVMFSQTETPQAEVTYTLTETQSVIKHLIVDLEPNFTYSIFQDGNLIDTKQASDQGTIYFTSQGASTFQITQGEFVAKPSIIFTKSVLINGQAATETSPGDELTYTITYRNTGTAEAKNIVISDAIPSGTVYLSGGDRVENGVVYWDIPSLPAGQQAGASFRARVE